MTNHDVSWVVRHVERFVTVLTESRRWTCKSSGAQEDLADGWSRTAVTRVEWQGMHMEYATRGWFGGLSLKTISGQFRRFGPQNPGGGFEKERTTRGGIEEFASRRSYLLKGVVAVG
jgi:hypothetical protein